MEYSKMSKEQLKEIQAGLLKEYESFKASGLKLNITRGVPSVEQLGVSLPMMDILKSDTDCISDGIDCRNYGTLDGIPEAKKLFADMLEVDPSEVIVCGNASLNIMYDTVSRSFSHGVCGSTPWNKLPKVKFLCPSPGYDRHFAVTQHFGCELIIIDMKDDGPDMDAVEKYVNNDPAVKGIWCVPKYSNPTGITYSDEVVRRFANLKPAAEDFRIFWDNAYVIHDLYDESDKLLSIKKACEEAGNPDMYYQFASTSKISFPGAGVAVITSSAKNIDFIKKNMFFQTIGYDKLNMLRHVRYYKNLDGLLAAMKQHANILRPKFEMVDRIFNEELNGLGIATWTKPRGGYFVSFDTLPNCAKRTYDLAAEAGVSLTAAGATYPYKKDPNDKNIRIAPSFPTLDNLEKALRLFCLCVKLAALEKMI